MDKIIQSPGKYIQGNGVIARLGQYAKPLAEKVLVIADSFVLGIIENTLVQGLQESKLAHVIAKFGGECCHTEINRLQALAIKEHCTAIIGIGGGKTLDTAKAVAYYTEHPVIIVPTIASTDAPCSALSVIYSDEGAFDAYLLLRRNPDIVLVDTQIVAQAPKRLLAAGIGDAMATYFEARACYRSQKATVAGGLCTETALTLAQLCYTTLLDQGYKAMLAVDQKVVTDAVERIIEANTYLSGVGFESGGLAAAHAIHNGLTQIADCHHFYHGEKVAFGALAQLLLENASTDEIDTVCQLCVQVGLPITLKQLDITSDIPAKIKTVAEVSCDAKDTMHNMPFEVTPAKVYAAILAADQYGQHYLARQA